MEERAETTSMDESAISEALSRHSSATIKRILSRSKLENYELERFLGVLRRSSQIVFRYPDKKEQTRNKMFRELRSIFEQIGNPHAIQRLEKELRTLEVLENGYRGILDLLQRTNIAAKSHEVQASAVLKRFAQQADLVSSQIQSAVTNAREFCATDEVRALDSAGEEYAADSVIEGLLQGLRITLMMLGNRAKWFDESKQLILPRMPDATEDECFQAGSLELLASSWRSWEVVEQRSRFLEGRLETLSGSSLPADIRTKLSRAIRSQPSEIEIIDWIANQRAGEFEMQNYMQLITETDASDRVTGIKDTAALMPNNFISVAELHANEYLVSVLGSNVVGSDAVWSGLSLVEWLRGYSALRELAIEVFEKSDDARSRNLSNWTEHALTSILTRLGISTDRSKIFLKAVTLEKESQDLFDCPLVRQLDGSFLLVGPAVRDIFPAKVVLSRLRSFQIRFEKKGVAFEQTVEKFFREKRFNAYSINTNRNGKAYEIDVIVPWDKYLFVFECKNRSLSAHHPVQAYYFAKERDTFIQQVKRQVHGLLQHPDMLTAVGGPDPRTKTIVPCILYSLPYAIPGSIDGVYVTDWSSLRRFFEERYAHIKIPYNISENTRFLHRTAVYSFWDDSEPTPIDLLRHLVEPFQLRAMLARMEQKEHPFCLSTDSIGVSTIIERKPANVEFFAELCGFDAKEVRRIQRSVAAVALKVRKQMEASNRRHAERQGRLAVRRWRQKRGRVF